MQAQSQPYPSGLVQLIFLVLLLLQQKWPKLLTYIQTKKSFVIASCCELSLFVSPCSFHENVYAGIPVHSYNCHSSALTNLHYDLLPFMSLACHHC